jgi:hypothetical protein
MSDEETLLRAIDEWKATSFRLESLDQYTVEHEEHLLGAFFRGDLALPFDQGLQDWLVQLRQERSDGKRRVRVHAMVGSLTPYLRYEIEWPYVACAAAGEDIRIIHRETWEETPFGARPPDYYLLDDATVAIMTYDGVGHWLGGEVITEPSEVQRYRDLRDQALAAAVPLPDYLAALRQAPIAPPVVQPSRLRVPA